MTPYAKLLPRSTLFGVYTIDVLNHGSYFLGHSLDEVLIPMHLGWGVPDVSTRQNQKSVPNLYIHTGSGVQNCASLTATGGVLA